MGEGSGEMALISCPEWMKLDRLHPRYGETLSLPLEYQKDNGKGL